MYSDLGFSDFHNEIADLLIDPEMFGTILGGGVTSVVIKPFYFYKKTENIKNPVLIITKDKLKKKTLSIILKKYKLFLEDINLEDFSEDLRDPLDILISYGFDCFYAPEFTCPNIDNNSALFSAISYIQQNYNDFPSNKDSFNTDYFLKEITQEYNFFKKDAKITLPFNRTTDLKVLTAIKNAMNQIKKTDISNNFSLDFHTGQFGLYENKIICFDPVFFH